MDWTSRSGNKNIILFNHLGMESDPTTLVVVDTWNHNDFVCMNYILNEFDNTPYSVYSLIKSAKTLWKVLIKKKKQKWRCWYEKVHSQQFYGLQNGWLKNHYKPSSRVSTYFMIFILKLCIWENPFK